MTGRKETSNMSKENTTIIGGNGFCGMLFITFLVLKLTNVINWSWWWVTAPLWVPLGLVAIVFVIICVMVVVTNLR